jgi:hypothetical protein
MMQMGVADLTRRVDMELELDARFEHREEDLSWLEVDLDDLEPLDDEA